MNKLNSEPSSINLLFKPGRGLQLEHALSESTPEYFGISRQIAKIAEPMQRLEDSQRIKGLRAFITGSIVNASKMRDLDLHFVFSKGSEARPIASPGQLVDEKYLMAVDSAFEAPKGGGVGLAIGLQLDYGSTGESRAKRHYPQYYDVNFTTIENMWANLENREMVGSNLWIEKFGIVVKEEFKSQYDTWVHNESAFMDLDPSAIQDLVPLNYILADCMGSDCQPTLAERFSTLVDEHKMATNLPQIPTSQTNIPEYIAKWLKSKTDDPRAREIARLLRTTKRPISPKGRLAMALFGKSTVEQVVRSTEQSEYKRALYPYLSALKGVSLWQAMRDPGSTVQILGEPLLDPSTGEQLFPHDSQFLQ
jgi:hypothetical protein